MYIPQTVSLSGVVGTFKENTLSHGWLSVSVHGCIQSGFLQSTNNSLTITETNYKLINYWFIPRIALRFIQATKMKVFPGSYYV